MPANFEQIVGIMELDGMTRTDAIFSAQKKFPDLHKDFLRRAKTEGAGDFDKAIRVTPPTFEDGVRGLQAKAGLTKAQAIEKAVSYWPGLHREYLERAQNGRNSIL